MKKNVGIIGYGNMGSAVAQRLKSEYQIWTFDKDKNKTKNLLGINIAGNIADLVNKVDSVILAVKPQDFDTVLMQIKKHIDAKLVISIAAGVSAGYIENQLGKTRVIRVMPNLPVKVGKGMICLCKGNYSNDTDLDFARQLFDCLGQTMLVKEDLMDAVTAISGSGPGFFYSLIQDKKRQEWEEYGREVFVIELSKAAEVVGFNPEEAELLSRATTQGSIALLKDTGTSPDELCRRVTSEGGTTEAGLKVLHSTGSLEEAAKAALKRARELSQK